MLDVSLTKLEAMSGHDHGCFQGRKASNQTNKTFPTISLNIKFTEEDIAKFKVSLYLGILRYSYFYIWANLLIISNLFMTAINWHCDLNIS